MPSAHDVDGLGAHLLRCFMGQNDAQALDDLADQHFTYHLVHALNGEPTDKQRSGMHVRKEKLCKPARRITTSSKAP